MLLIVLKIKYRWDIQLGGAKIFEFETFENLGEIKSNHENCDKSIEFYLHFIMYAN